MALSPSTNVRINVVASTAAAREALRSLRVPLRDLGNDTIPALNAFRGLDRVWTLMAVGSGAALVTTFVKMASEIQKTKLQIVAFEGSLKAIDPSMDKIFNLLDRVPFTLNTMGQAFVKFKAAGLDPIVDAQGNGPLKALADAVAAFGGGDEIFKRATIAIQQMAGKGVISMEELRQQLGEAIPVAMRVMADELDITVGELIRTVSQGNLEFKEGSEALFRGLERVFGGAGELLNTTFSGAVIQAKNAFQEFSDILDRSGALDVLTVTLNMVSTRIREITDRLRELSKAGQLDVDPIVQALRKAAIWALQLWDALRVLGTAFGQLVATAMSALGGLSPNAIVGGLVGFFLFGRTMKSAFMGAAILQLASPISKLIKGVLDLLRGIPGGMEALSLGIIGYFFFGPKGRLILAGVTALEFFGQAVRQLIHSTARLIFDILGNIVGVWDAILVKGILDPRKIAEHADAAGRAYREGFSKGVTGNTEGKFESTVFLSQALGLFNNSTPGAFFGSTTGVDEATERVDRFFGTVKDGIEGIAETRERVVSQFGTITDLIGLSPQELTEFERVLKSSASLREQAIAEVSGGGANNRLIATTQSDIDSLGRLVDSITNKLNDLSVAHSRMEQFRKEIQKYSEETAKFAENGFSILSVIEKSINESLLKTGKVLEKGEKEKAFIIKEQDSMRASLATIIGERSRRATDSAIDSIDRLNQTLIKGLRDASKEFTFAEKAVADVRDTYAGYEKRLQNVAKELGRSITTTADQAKVNKALDDSMRLLNQARDEAIIKATREAEIEEKLLVLKTQSKGINFELQQIQLFKGPNSDPVKVARLQMQGQINALRISLQEEIIRISDVLDSVELSNANAEALRRIRMHLREQLKELDDSTDDLLDMAERKVSEWGKFLENVKSITADALKDALVGLINGSKNFEDVMVAAFHRITEAAAEFIIQQLIIKRLFESMGQSAGGSGGMGGFDGSLQSIFSMAGKFFALGGAKGLDFMVGGSGGTDSQFIPLAVTPGERVIVQTPDQQHAGLNGGAINVNISAVDAQSVERLFRQQGDLMNQMISQSMRLNKGPR